MSDAPTEAPPRTTAQKAGWVAIAVTLIGGFEGLRQYAYRDVIGVKTICSGHTVGVKMGDHFSVAYCKKLLAADLSKYNAMARKCIPRIDDFPLHRHAAIVSFTYNVGGGALCRSSVARHLNAGRVEKGCDALLRYSRGGGRILRGLRDRRRTERKLCLKDN